MYLREMRNRDATVKLDVTGAVLVTGGARVGHLRRREYHDRRGWGPRSRCRWFLGGAIALVASSSSGSPTWPRTRSVPFRIFRSRALSTANVVMFLVGGAFFAMWYFLTYYFQFILQYGPVKAGFAFLPMAIAIIAGAQISSRLMSKTGVRPILLVGATFAHVRLPLDFADQGRQLLLGAILCPRFICAFAMGLLFSPLATAATAGVDRADAGLASGVLNTARQVGGSLALAILAPSPPTARDSSRARLTRPSPWSAATSGPFRSRR